MSQTTLVATTGRTTGSSASRRLRAADQIPGVIYGQGMAPITLAVGHSFATGRQVLDFPPGTRFYFPALRRYAIVEDVCGDGNSPQNGPCHTGHKGLPWIDIYVDGRKSGRGAANACMNRITGIHDVIVNPPANLPVQRGALTESGCST